MHYTGLLGASIDDAKSMGWEVKEGAWHSWEKMAQAVQAYIKMLNWEYRRGLRSTGVTFYNALAHLVGPNTVEYHLKGEAHRVTSSYIVVAVGSSLLLSFPVPSND